MCTEIPEVLCVVHMNMYDTIRHLLEMIVHLDPNRHQSLLLWKTKLKEKGYLVIYMLVRVQAIAKSSFIFGFVLPWQKTVHKLIILLDWQTNASI